MAAGRTVDQGRVHSLHSYFLRPGDPKVPILYEVDRIRDGKSFTTRRVVAIQHGRAIFNLQASFHTDEPGPDYQPPMPLDVPAADSLPDAVQDAYSLRCIPQVHGVTRDALQFAGAILERELNSATDNPMIFTDTQESRSGGNFHGQPVAIGEIGEIGLVARVVTVDLKGGDEARRSGVHEGFGFRCGVLFESGAEASDIVVQRLERDKADIADARCADEFLAAHDRGKLLRKLGHFGKIRCRLAVDMATEAREALDHVGRVADFAEFAVRNDGNARIDLLRHGRIDRREFLSRAASIAVLGGTGLAMAQALLPRYVTTQIFGGLLEREASEQGASMTAMDNATRNAGELIQKLTIQYNRSRQAAITTELIEIIAGAEAL